MRRKRTISQPVTLILLVLMLVSLCGCFTTPELGKVSPQIVTSGAPLSQGLGKVGINLATTEVTLQTPTSGAILKKQFWKSFAQGNTAATDLYWKIVSPVAVLLSGCGSSYPSCSSDAVTLSNLVILAALGGSMTVGTVSGIVEAAQAKYSWLAEGELEQAVSKAVTKANDEIRNAIIASSKSLLFQYMRQHGEGKAVAALDENPIVEIMPPDQGRDRGLDLLSVPMGQEGINSVIDVGIREVTLTDGIGWFNSKFQLRVRVETNLYRTGDASLIDKRDYTCVSIPRTYQYWSVDSYKNIREELVECNQLLGQHVANDLLGATMRNDPGRKAQ